MAYHTFPEELSPNACLCVNVCQSVWVLCKRNTYRGDINKDKNKETGCQSKRASAVWKLLFFCFPQSPSGNNKPATENGGPCVVFKWGGRARVHTRYSTDIIVGPAHSLAGQVGPQGILGGKKSHVWMILRAIKGEDAVGHQSIALLLSPLSSHPSRLPSTNQAAPPLCQLHLRCFISLSWWLFPPPSLLSSILIASIR